MIPISNSNWPNHGAFRPICFGLILFFCLPTSLTAVAICYADDMRTDRPGMPPLDTQWGGHLRGIGTVSYPNPDSIYQWTGLDPYYDGQLEVRLKNNTFIASHWSLESHLEVVGYGGDSLSKTREFRNRFPEADGTLLFGLSQVNDNHRLFNLSHQVLDEKDRQLHIRLDRLNISYNASWGSLHLGRQAITWGNGLIFNPMDLFTPFSPSAVLRDYKMGDDIVNLQTLAGIGELQVVCVPHRELESGNVNDSVSTYAAKWHQSFHAIELDLMAARHYEDQMMGLGASGYLGGAAWRMDTVYTHGGAASDPVDYIQWLVNLDSAWQWQGHSIYGFIEIYYNGLGKGKPYADAFDDVYVRQRLVRGDQFTLGRIYISGQLQVEHHPLVHSQWTILFNGADGSGFLQPHAMFDLTENWQLLAGGTLYWGGDDTEFGGYPVSFGNLDFKVVPSDSLFLWLTYYF